MNHLTLIEADDESAQEIGAKQTANIRIKKTKMDLIERQISSSSIKEASTALPLLFDSDVGLKKRKRYGKLYEEEDNNIISQVPNEPCIQNDPHAVRHPEKESLITPDRLEKALQRKGLIPKRDNSGTWELSSSSSSRSQSKRASSTEGSIDFGSETRGTISGDWDDAPIITDAYITKDSDEIQETSLKVTDKVVKEDVRFSFLSTVSADADKDETFPIETESEIPLEAEGMDSSSSSDESDIAEEPSKSRISAATLYEHAVLQALEGSNGKHFAKSNDQDNTVSLGKATVAEPEIKEAGEICIKDAKDKFVDKVPSKKSNIHQLEEDESCRDNATIQNSVEETGNAKGVCELPTSSSGLPPKDDIVEIVYEVVTVTRSKVVAVPEVATIMHLPEENDLMEESDASVECAGDDLVPVEVGERRVEVLAAKQHSVKENVPGGTKLLCTNLKKTVEDIPSKISTENARLSEDENCFSQSADTTLLSADEKQRTLSLAVDSEEVSGSDVRLHHSFCSPEYTGNVREEKEMFETTIESLQSPPLHINIVPFEVFEEAQETAELSEVSTHKPEDFKVSYSGNHFESHSRIVTDVDSNSKFGYLDTDPLSSNIVKKVETTAPNNDNVKSQDDDKDKFENEKERRLSEVSSSSGSSFEMVENEIEVDLEEQLSSQESFNETPNIGRDNISENDSESDEGLDTIEKPDTFELQKVTGSAVIPLDIKLERHVSIDSSVSTLSEAETVIHIPIGNLSKTATETASVKDDSQIGVKAVKRDDDKGTLMRSVSEELLTKTSDSEHEVDMKEKSKLDSHDEDTILKGSDVQNKDQDSAPKCMVSKVSTSTSSSEDYVLIRKSKPFKGGVVAQDYVCELVSATISPLEDESSQDNIDFYSTDEELDVSGRYVVYDSSKPKNDPLKVGVSASALETEATVPVTPDKGYFKLKEHDLKTSGGDSEKQVDVKRNVKIDTDQDASVADNEPKINYEPEKQNTKFMTERRVSVDVAQVIQTTEVSEEQEVSISIPDVHLEDLKDEGSTLFDEESNYNLACKTKKNAFGKTVDMAGLERPVQKKENVKDIECIDSTVIDAIESSKCFEDTKPGTYENFKSAGLNLDEGPSCKYKFSALPETAFGFDQKPETLSDKQDEHCEKEVMLGHYELKDTDFIFVNNSALKNEQHKEKDSSSSCDTSNSTGSSPYYDASGEMVESLGSDEVSSSMEVLHPSVEILDMPSWTSNVDVEPENMKDIRKDSDASIMPSRETKKKEPHALDQEHSTSSRFSTISVCTDASEGEVIFSETEGEEFPYEDTTDDDLTLEEEAIKVMVEVRASYVREKKNQQETSGLCFGIGNGYCHIISKIHLWKLVYACS